jgi:hypothetical protein
LSAVSRRRKIGPVFFNETITAERYQELIMNFISLLEAHEQDCWFQQNGATAHTENSTIQMLSEFFGGRIISRNLWPPSIPGYIGTGFLSVGDFEERVQRQHAYIRRI